MLASASGSKPGLAADSQSCLFFCSEQVNTSASLFICRLPLISNLQLLLMFFHYAKLSVASAHTFKNKGDLVSTPANDQGNQAALMSNVLVILSLDRIKVVGILSLRKSNYAGNKSGDRGYILILKE